MVDLVDEVGISHGGRLYQLYLEIKKDKFNYKTCLIEWKNGRININID